MLHDQSFALCMVLIGGCLILSIFFSFIHISNLISCIFKLTVVIIDFKTQDILMIALIASIS